VADTLNFMAAVHMSAHTLLTALLDTSAHSVRPGYLMICQTHQHIL